MIRFFRSPHAPYVLPFAAFMLLLAMSPWLDRLGQWEYVVRTAGMAALIAAVSRKELDFRTRKPLWTVIVGTIMFLLWVAPEWIVPSWRSHWLFQNRITGEIQASLSPQFRDNAVVLVMRSVRAVVIVPIVEELFWRAWLMRWLADSDFRKLPLGAYVPTAFWITAALFALEHGPYWEVGLMAGVIYNWWMVRTRSLGDCILAHAVTNALLSIYVILGKQWQYWG